MRLLRRIYRYLNEQCECCGTKLTNIERVMQYRNCLRCESGK